MPHVPERAQFACVCVLYFTISRRAAARRAPRAALGAGDLVALQLAVGDESGKVRATRVRLVAAAVEERERGVTISCTTKEFFTEKWHYTIIDAPGHRDFIKNMISGAAQADVCCLMVPADGNFTTAIQKGNHKAGEVQGQTRQHVRLINLLGVKQMHRLGQDGPRHRRIQAGAVRRDRQ